MSDPLGLPLPSRSHTQTGISRIDVPAVARAPVAGEEVSADRAASVAVVAEPSISTGAALLVGAGRTAAPIQPRSRFSVSGSAVAAPDEFSAAASVGAPTVLLGEVAEAPLAVSVAGARQAYVSVGVSVTASPPKMAAAATVDGPDVTGIVNEAIPAGRAEAAASVDAPTLDIGTSVDVDAGRAEAAAGVDAPDAEGTVGLRPDRGAAAAVARQGSIDLGAAQTVAPDRAAAIGSVYAPEIDAHVNDPIPAGAAYAGANVRKVLVIEGQQHVVSPGRTAASAEAHQPGNSGAIYPARVGVAAAAFDASAGELLRETMIFYSPFYGTLLVGAEIPEMEGVYADLFRSLSITAEFWEEG